MEKKLFGAIGGLGIVLLALAVLSRTSGGDAPAAERPVTLTGRTEQSLLFATQLDAGRFRWFDTNLRSPCSKGGHFDFAWFSNTNASPYRWDGRRLDVADTGTYDDYRWTTKLSATYAAETGLRGTVQAEVFYDNGVVCRSAQARFPSGRPPSGRLAAVLDGRTVLVTGASSGIGRTTALLLAQRGARVLAGVRTKAAGEALGDTVTPVQLDVTNRADIDALPLDRLDGLVNNAGIAVTAPLEFLPLDELRHQLEVNVIAQLAVTQACMPALRASHGRIVNVSSISGRVALPLYGPYAASKFALEALSDSLRREQQDVQVILVEPGSIATPIWDRSLAAADALYAAMPPIAHERYDALVTKLRTMAAGQGEDGEPPEAVARVIATALGTAKPRTRYVIGRSARIQATLARALPGRALDKVLARALRS